MTTTQQVITIAVMSAGVILTRFLPFILFPTKEHTPRFVHFLGKYLPSAVFGMLVVYCLKDAPVSGPTHALPQLAGVVATIALHLWKKSMFVSIAGGTICYMLVLGWG